MSTPLSLSPAPLSGLGDHSFKKLFEDDFGVNKATLKAKGTSANGGVLNYKGALNLAKSYAPGQETKFQLPYKNYYLWFATRPQETKVHVDLGEFQLGVKQNLFVNGIFYNSSKATTLRFGSVYNGPAFLSHSRLEWRQQQTWRFFQRIAGTKGKLSYIFSEEFDFETGAVSRHDWLLGYKTQDYDLYLRHLTLEKANFPILGNFGVGRLLVDAVYRKASNTYGVEAEFKNLGNYGLSVGFATKKNGVDIKAKLDVVDRILGLSFKGKLNDTFGYTLATQVPVDGSAPKAAGLFPIPVGITLETNV